jgi:CBS domain-containing protein
MSLRNLLDRELVSCRPDTTIKEVSRMMDGRNVGCIVVMDNDRPVGIITDRDIVVRCIAAGKDCTTVAVRELMSEPVSTSPLDGGIFNVVQCMRNKRVRRIPIVDENGKAVGLVSTGDIMEILGSEMADLSYTMVPENPKLERQAA